MLDAFFTSIKYSCLCGGDLSRIEKIEHDQTMETVILLERSPSSPSDENLLSHTVSRAILKLWEPNPERNGNVTAPESDSPSVPLNSCRGL